MNSHKKIPSEVTACKIIGNNCGRDENGAFRCVCGMCKPLRKQSEGSGDGGKEYQL